MAAVLALDLGSTQLKLLVMDEKLHISYVGVEGYPTQAPKAGYLEQRPQDWVTALERGMRTLKEQRGTQDIAAISFSGHMSGVVLVNGAGSVLRPCIMLADTRSQAQCDRLCVEIGALVKQKTGNLINNAFSLPKLLWLKEQESDLYSQAAAWLSPKDYLRLCLTGEFATEYTDAYNSLCVSRSTSDWCDQIIQAAGLDRTLFPPMLAPDQPAGAVTREAAQRFGLTEGTPVYAGGADMACGAVGMGLFTPGDSALTIGTCATFLAPVPDLSDEAIGQVTFHLHALKGEVYALGSHMNGGLAVNWLSKLLKEDEQLDFDLIRALSDAAAQVPAGSGGVLTIPFLAGSGSPYFDPVDRETILGLNPSVTRGQIFRSMLEGITVNLAQTKHAFDRMVDGGLRRVLLGGGGSKIGVWPQMIADVFRMRMELASNTDASSVGAALLGGAGAGMFTDLRAAAQTCLTIKRTYEPSPADCAVYDALMKRYERAYHLLHDLYKEFNQ